MISGNVLKITTQGRKGKFSNKKLYLVVIELFIRDWKLNSSWSLSHNHAYLYLKR